MAGASSSDRWQDVRATLNEHHDGRRSDGDDRVDQLLLDRREVDAERVARLTLGAVADEPGAGTADREHDDIRVASGIDGTGECLVAEVGQDAGARLDDDVRAQRGEFFARARRPRTGCGPIPPGEARLRPTMSPSGRCSSTPTMLLNPPCSMKTPTSRAAGKEYAGYWNAAAFACGPTTAIFFVVTSIGRSPSFFSRVTLRSAIS